MNRSSIMDGYEHNHQSVISMLYDIVNSTIQMNEQLAELETARSKLTPFARVPNEYAIQLRRHILAESIHYSTRIEGNTLSLQQVETLLAGGHVSAPTNQVQEVQNYREALSFVQNLVNEPEPLSEQTIKTIHYLVTKSLDGDYASGRYRIQQNYVVDRFSQQRLYVPPPPQQVPSLMAELVQWLNSRREYPAPIPSGLAHLNFVAIHPFMDGNGRTARVLESLVLYFDGYRNQELVSLEAYYGRDTRSYYAALSEALGPYYSPPRDVTRWVEYYLTAHLEQVRLPVEQVEAMTAFIEHFFDVFPADYMSKDEREALFDAIFSRQITNRGLRELTRKSHQTAAKILGSLVQKGYLVRIGGGRSVAYVPTATIWRQLSGANLERVLTLFEAR